MGARRLDNLPYYTYDDYKHWEGKWELIDGIPYAMSPAPLIVHQSLAYTIAKELGNQLEDCEHCLVLGEADWKLKDDTVFRPDVVLICDEPNEKYISKTPEIIVEVISKSSVMQDEIRKFEIYEEEKVPYYIIVYPDDLKAKIYKQKDGKFDKVGDFFQESYTFEETTCKVSLDFYRVFKRYLKK